MFIVKNKVDFFQHPSFSPVRQVKARSWICHLLKEQTTAVFPLNTSHQRSIDKDLAAYSFALFWSRVRANLKWCKSFSNGFSTFPYAYVNSLMLSYAGPLSLKWIVEAFFSINFTQSARDALMSSSLHFSITKSCCLVLRHQSNARGRRIEVLFALFLL